MFNETTIDDVKDFVLNWNLRYPIDRWWREKHNISFNSEVHRVSSFIDQLIEFEEDKMFRELIKEELEKGKEDNEERLVKEYVPGYGNFLKKREFTPKDADEAFSNLSLENFEL